MTQAGMIDERAFPVSAGAACYGVTHYEMVGLLKRCPASIVRRAKDGDAGSVQRIGQVRGAGIIGYKQVQ